MVVLHCGFMYIHNTLDVHVCILCVCVCESESESERERLGDLNFSCFSCTILCCCSTHPRPTDYGICVRTHSCSSCIILYFNIVEIIIAAIHVHMYSYIGAYPGAVGLHIDSM